MTTPISDPIDIHFGHCDSCDRKIPRSSLRGDPDKWMGCGRCAIRCFHCYFLDNQCSRCREQADETEREGLEEIEDLRALENFKLDEPGDRSCKP